MCRTFSHYKSISYSEKCKDNEILKKKRSQAAKIVEITNQSSHVQNYIKQLIQNFYFKTFWFFASGMMSAFISNFFEYYITKFSVRHGIDKRIRIIKIKEETII